MSSFDYCDKCGKPINICNPKHDCIRDPVNFEELDIKERTILLAAFDYGVDAEGYILTPNGDRIFSKEKTGECLKVDNTLLISGPGGKLEIHDGTPIAISAYLRRLEKEDIVRALLFVL